VLLAASVAEEVATRGEPKDEVGAHHLQVPGEAIGVRGALRQARVVLE
jgi:hypothetical protein